MKIGIAGLAFYVTLILLALYGWVMNLLDVIHSAVAGDPITTLFVCRIIGIPVGILGSILGWF